ncbi:MULTISPECIES: HepT-like ribonuclease domain-containing protein [unclassified Isoptericola]|uniref:HepT-like ribonuclease domain-containing protein n=1 Tax=unclassified Isoptericola TaxID=2623355 RepID=UPI00364739C8
MNARTRRWLGDLVDHAATVERLVDRGKDAYDADEMLRYAAEDLLIRLGECVSRIDRDDRAFVDAHPDLELRRIKDARNVIAHGYDVVDTELLWAILSVNIPEVARRVADLLAQEPSR